MLTFVVIRSRENNNTDSAREDVKGEGGRGGCEKEGGKRRRGKGRWRVCRKRGMRKGKGEDVKEEEEDGRCELEGGRRRGNMEYVKEGEDGGCK